MAKIATKSANDLKSGLGYFTRWPKSLMCAAKSAKPTQT
jgi:hypothetical protein